MGKFQLNSKVLEGFDTFGMDSELLSEAIELNRKLEAAGFQVTITSKSRRTTRTTTTRRAAKKKVKRRTTTTRKTKAKTKKRRRGAANQAKATRTYWNEINQIAADQDCTKKQARKIYAKNK